MAANVLSNEGSHAVKYTTVTGNLPVTAGTLQIIGNTPMIPLETATTAGVAITCQVGGAVLLPKRAAAAATGGAWVAGGRVYYITTSGGENQVTGLAAAGQMIGYGLETTTTGATTAKVHLIDNATVKEDQT